MATLGVVPDGVSGLQSEPLRERTVLLHLLSQSTLKLKALDSSLKI